MTDVAASAEIARAAVDLAIEVAPVNAPAQFTVLPVRGLPEIKARR